ncbi:MAG: 50S ribosomal protein L17 [Chloroflexota bacterium]|nr:MAG: 50S ribosomal protein L17 [Chloroflexota bacterium]
MRHRMTGRSLGRPSGERIALFRGLVTELIRYEKIRTTLPKAKEVRPIAEKAITLAKRGDLNARRLLLGRLYGDEIVDKAIHVLGLRFADRPGGYTRITRIGRRLGDNAEMAVIEFVE